MQDLASVSDTSASIHTLVLRLEIPFIGLKLPKVYPNCYEAVLILSGPLNGDIWERQISGGFIFAYLGS